MKSGHLEVEIKLKVEDLRSTRRLIRKLGFRRAGPRRLERNTIWDTPSGRLRREGKLLRLRTVVRETTLTVKERARRSKLKVRPEWQFRLDRTESGPEALTALGFNPVFVYEKYRTVFLPPGRKGRQLLVDETPMGAYLELEGDAAWIRKTAQSLGYSPGQFITDTYAGLYLHWRRSRQRAPRDMIFPPR